MSRVLQLKRLGFDLGINASILVFGSIAAGAAHYCFTMRASMQVVHLQCPFMYFNRWRVAAEMIYMFSRGLIIWPCQVNPLLPGSKSIFNISNPSLTISIKPQLFQLLHRKL